MEAWLEPWVRFRTNDLDDFNFDDDAMGFFRPDRPGYRPGAFHPVVLRILRRQFAVRLEGGNPEDEEAAGLLCDWLVENIFRAETELLGATPEVAFAAGALVLGLAASHHNVEIGDDGAITAPDASAFWAKLAEEVIAAVVRNSEDTEETLVLWRGRENRIQDLFNACPEWHTTPLLSNLRSRAEERLKERLSRLSTVLPQEASRLQPDQFVPTTEMLASRPLPKHRPEWSTGSGGSTGAEPYAWVDSTRQEYAEQLRAMDKDEQKLEDDTKAAREISQRSRQARQSFETRFASPLARFVAPDLTMSALNGASVLTTYLQRQTAHFMLNVKNIKSDGEEITESLDTYEEWIKVIKPPESDEPLEQTWARLEAWDALRGRLTRHPSDDDLDRGVANLLLKRNVGPPGAELDLQQWLNADPPNAEHLDRVRPVLAALVHLGLVSGRERFQNLKQRTEALLSRHIDLDVDVVSLLAAARLELGLTAVAAGAPVSVAFDQVGTENLDHLFTWTRLALASKVAWEVRAGMNMLILLARLSEVTGDMLIATKLSAMMAEREAGPARANQLVNDALSHFLDGTGTQSGSGLPLALAAFDLQRYSRTSAQSIHPSGESDRPGKSQNSSPTPGGTD